jgi:hypothetical protein
MYDYYIVMKSMFLVVKLSFTQLLVMQTSPFPFHELHINNTKTIQKPKAFPKSKLQLLQTLYSYHDFVQNEGVFQGHNHLLIY